MNSIKSHLIAFEGVFGTQTFLNCNIRHMVKCNAIFRIKFAIKCRLHLNICLIDHQVKCKDNQILIWCNNHFFIEIEQFNSKYQNYSNVQVWKISKRVTIMILNLNYLNSVNLAKLVFTFLGSPWIILNYVENIPTIAQRLWWASYLIYAF